MILQDLNNIAEKAKLNYANYNQEEIELSEEFKRYFTEVIEKSNKEKVSFSKYTTIVHSSKGLTITFPNQWFYIASYFVDFLSALFEYRKNFNEIFDTIKNTKALVTQIKNTNEVPDNIKAKISNHFILENDAINFEKFISDYDWWFGSKTIDRGDYFVSPILSLSQVIHASQSYIAHLTYIFTVNPNLVDLLNDSTVSPQKPKQYSQNESVLNNIKVDFADWLFDKAKYYRVYNGDKDTLIEKLTEYEIAYNNDFGILIFDYPNLSKGAIISQLELNNFDSSIEIGDIDKRTVGNGSVKAILGSKNYIKFLKEYNEVQNSIQQGPFEINKFKEDCEESGLKYSTQLITRYVASLATKPFVLLSGLSGSGKTKLAQSFAQWISESKDQYCIVPVGADWTNREPLLGYVNALDPRQYILPENGALALIIEANKEENKNRPYFLILDEMNLSHVERYFADFLSVMESNETFSLHSGKTNLNITIEEDGVTKYADTIEVPNKIGWPKNLFVVGTVNIDETTYMFSPKVLDRANVIEFRVDKEDMIKYLDKPKKLTELNGEGKTMGEDFVIKAKNKSKTESKNLNDALENFFESLQKVGAEFGYRTASEIQTLFGQLGEFNPAYKEGSKELEKIDIAIMQKLLPKLHGSRRKLAPVIETLGNLCIVENNVKQVFFESKESIIYKGNVAIKFPLSLEKIVRMYKSLLDNGFASYAEA